MSRYVKKVDTGDVAYGFDIAEGYFFQLFGDDIDGEDNLIINESSLFTGLSNARMAELMDKYECDSDHQNLVMMDLPI